jgi:hypothetical protein
MAAIDSKSFEDNREVTCYSCHRGSPKPVATPMIANETPSQPVESAKPASILPTADELIAKYIHALGGADAIEKITSREEIGQATRGQRGYAVELFYQDPNKQAVITHVLHQESFLVFNQNQGWRSSFPGRPPEEMHGDELDAARVDSDLHFPLHIKQNFAELRVEYPEKIANHEAFVISCANIGHPAVKLYFDEQSGLLVRLVRYAQSPLGLVPTQIDYADYRDVDGVKIPFRRMTFQPDNTSTMQLAQVRQNIPIDGTRFAKPALAADPKPTK